MAVASERRAVACVLFAITAVVAAASYDRERLEIAKQILEEVPLTDGHNDLPWNIRKFLRNQINEFELDTDLRMVEPWSFSKYSHTDLPRLREGMVGAQGSYLDMSRYATLKHTRELHYVVDESSMDEELNTDLGELVSFILQNHEILPLSLIDRPQFCYQHFHIHTVP